MLNSCHSSLSVADIPFNNNNKKKKQQQNKIVSIKTFCEVWLKPTQ